MFSLVLIVIGGQSFLQTHIQTKSHVFSLTALKISIYKPLVGLLLVGLFVHFLFYNCLCTCLKNA